MKTAALCVPVSLILLIPRSSLLNSSLMRAARKKEGVALPNAFCSLFPIPCSLSSFPYSLLTVTWTPCAYCSRKYTPHAPGGAGAHEYFTSGWGASNPAWYW